MLRVVAWRCCPRAVDAVARRWLALPSHQVVGLPALSPTMELGTIAAWKVGEGAEFGAGDVLCEIETDKATVDFEAQDGGVLAKILVEKGREVKVGAPIMVVVEELGDAAAFADFPPDAAPAASEAAPAPAGEPAAAAQPAGDGAAPLMMPAASFMANSKKIDVSQLSGSGKGGRITKGDIILALNAGVTFPALASAAHAAAPVAPAAAAAAAAAASPAPATAAPAAASGPLAPFQNAPRILFDTSSEVATDAPYEDTPASGMRKVISKRLTESRAYVPHSYTTASVQVDSVAAMRKMLVDEFGIRVSVNDIVIRAAALALRDVPRVNSSWNGSTCVPNKTIDISVAVATPTGLITPIVFNAVGKGLSEISAEIRDLAGRAKIGKLKPEEYQGGTFSVSNLGMFGIQEFAAVINPPQACILAVGGGIQELVLGAQGAPEPATVMTSRLSSDRRVVDEPLAAQFMQVFSHYIANPKLLMV